MPWIARYDGEKKGPHQVPEQTDVECLECGELMRVWRRSSDGRARHFKHLGDIGAGSGGGRTSACDSVAESDIHIKWKSLAVDCLEQAFEGNIETCVMERRLDAPVSEKAHRDGDVVVEFEERDPQLGKGIVAEVQHKHEDKDIEVTTADYIEQNFAVVWLDEGDFANDRCRLTEADLRKRARPKDWPEYVPASSKWQSQNEMVARDVKVWRNAKAFDDVEYGAPATLPREWVDEAAQQVWSDTQWERIMERAGPRAETYRAQAAVPHIDSTRERRTSLRPVWLETLHFRESSWESLFVDEHPSESATSSQEITLEFSPTLPNPFWKDVFERPPGPSSEPPYDVERPPGPHEDVQCHECGHYNYVKNADLVCQNCGEPYNWGWNVRTNRISRDSVPDHVSL